MDMRTSSYDTDGHARTGGMSVAVFRCRPVSVSMSMFSQFEGQNAVFARKKPAIRNYVHVKFLKCGLLVRGEFL